MNLQLLIERHISHLRECKTVNLIEYGSWHIIVRNEVTAYESESVVESTDALIEKGYLGHQAIVVLVHKLAAQNGHVAPCSGTIARFPK